MRQRSWSPWLVGGLIGVLSWGTVLTADEYLGTSTSFVQTVGMVEQAVAPARVAEHSYFSAKPPTLDWQWMLVVGIFLGAALSARMSGDVHREVVPPLWARRFGPGPGLRMAGAVAGGALLMYGARLAGGCTSGHGISGTLQLALSSWVFFACFFVTGMAGARLIYGKAVGP